MDSIGVTYDAEAKPEGEVKAEVTEKKEEEDVGPQRRAADFSTVAGESKPVVSTGGSVTDDKTSNPCKCFLGGLSWETTELSLRSYFHQCKLLDAVIMKDKYTGKPRGFGFATFDQETGSSLSLLSWARCGLMVHVVLSQ